MKINDLLKGVDCSCGRKHKCDIRHIAIGKNAIDRLGDITAEFQNILLVADENTYAAAGRQTEKALKGKTLGKVIFPGKPLLIPNETAIARVKRELAGVGLLIGIGSGVIQDLCKYVSHTEGIPYYIVATAPSMDGYDFTGNEGNGCRRCAGSDCGRYAGAERSAYGDDSCRLRGYCG